MTGLRINTQELKRRLQRKRARITANAFRPELMRFAKASLSDAMKSTPVRSLSVITKNQKKQYELRCNYIPSVHSEDEPRLIVNDAGEHWLFASGQWWAASFRDLPSGIDEQYQELVMERERRLATSEAEFIAERAQARFLYRKSWREVAQSIGIRIAATSQITDAHSRHNPPKDPPKGYAQIRGGKKTLSVVVYNSFLEQPSDYKPFSGKAILDQAISKNNPRFMRDVLEKLNTILATA